jgi:hypothetical protein
MVRLCLLIVFYSLACPAWAQSITIQSSPGTIYIEAGPYLQELNFDFMAVNSSSAEFTIEGIELSVFGAKGALARREFFDRNSRRHAELVPDRKVAARGRLMLFNPFHTFAADVPLHELRYRFTLKANDGRVEFADVTVRPVTFVPKTRLIPPLRGRLLIWDGHDYASHHRRMDYSVPMFGLVGRYQTNFQRYGFDFVVVDAAGQMSRTPLQTTEDFYHHDPANNANFYGFGAEVLAAAAGRVVELHDSNGDDLRFDPKELAERETAYGGNYIIIDHGNGEFSWYGHLKQNSLRVQAGQTVKQGETIAQLGASGSSLFPHLHFEMRTAAGAGRAEGLPSFFTGFRRPAGTAVKTPTPLNTGDLIEVP